jgi:hypothetical protein
MNLRFDAERFGVRWQAKRDTALALQVAAPMESCPAFGQAYIKAPSPLRSAGALQVAQDQFVGSVRFDEN